MELIALKNAHEFFGISRTTVMMLKKYDPNFPPVRGQAGRGFAFDKTELAVYFSKKYPDRDYLALLMPATSARKTRKASK